MIKIVTDSTGYLPEATIKKYDIRIVPLYVHFGNEAFREGVDLSHEQFYARLKEAPELPTTSQPSAGEFLEVFKELAGAGHEILVLTISSKLSGTWDSAMAAKQMLPEATIEVVDSLSAAMGLHLMVNAAAEIVAAGTSLQETVYQVEAIRSKMSVVFVVDTLEYLAKGGRIGNARAFLGTLLKVKPILALQDGVIEPLEQVRSKRKAQARLVGIVEETVGDKAAETVLTVSNALAPADGERLARELVLKLHCAEPDTSSIGPVIGTHTGPGVVGVGFYA